MSIIGFPLLLIPLAVCNIIIFLMPGVAFDAPLAKPTLPSGASWTLTIGDLLLALGVVLLLLEVVKGSRPGAKYVTDHLLSLLVFGGALGEFLLLPQFGNSTILLLASLALVDFLSGLALRNRRRAAHAAKTIKPAKIIKSAKPLPGDAEPIAATSDDAAVAPPPALAEPAQPAIVAAAPHLEAPRSGLVDVGAAAPVPSPDLQPEQPKNRPAAPPAR